MVNSKRDANPHEITKKTMLKELQGRTPANDTLLGKVKQRVYQTQLMVSVYEHRYTHNDTVVAQGVYFVLPDK